MSVDLPPVVGDAAGMRALAAALRAAAVEVEAMDAAVWNRVTCLPFTGPAATRLTDDIASWHALLASAVASLAETAGLLERSAAEVEAEQAARARQLALLDHGTCVP